MKRQNPRHELDEFLNIWSENEQYFIWGTSNSALYLMDNIGFNLNIIGFIDSNIEFHGKCFKDKIVYSFADFIEKFNNNKIIVASGAYAEIRPILRNAGLVEFKDFCDSRYFLSSYSIKKKNQLILARTDLSITEYCNLRCKHCNMLMPYFKNPKHRDLNKLKNDVDTYFKWVDKVQLFNILGGEPFIYPNVYEITKYICEKYRSRIHQLIFFSNGTIVPSDKMIDLMHEYKIEVQISDYRNGLPNLTDKIDLFKHKLKSSNISYRAGADESWISFGFPDFKHNDMNENDLIKFFDECYAPFRGLYNQKLYYCHLQASAEMANIFESQDNDYFDLSVYDEDKKIDLAEFDLGYTNSGSISYCKRCKGCFSVNNSFVPVAEQLER